MDQHDIDMSDLPPISARQLKNARRTPLPRHSMTRLNWRYRTTGAHVRTTGLSAGMARAAA